MYGKKTLDIEDATRCLVGTMALVTRRRMDYVLSLAPRQTRRTNKRVLEKACCDRLSRGDTI
jgi:hypothetical protein